MFVRAYTFNNRRIMRHAFRILWENVLKARERAEHCQRLVAGHSAQRQVRCLRAALRDWRLWSVAHRDQRNRAGQLLQDRFVTGKIIKKLNMR
mgnify:CR=1 FL=1